MYHLLVTFIPSPSPSPATDRIAIPDGVGKTLIIVLIVVVVFAALVSGGSKES